MADAAGKFDVLVTKSAEQDLEAIYDYVAASDSVASAEHVLDQLTGAIENLSRFPGRGSYPKELGALGIHEYRQVFFKPYRVICRINERKVVIYLIADGRRDMQAFLMRRLLGA
jgi:toxin ParE1/3/4